MTLLIEPINRRTGWTHADQRTTAPLKNANTNALIKQCTYGYDPASNRTSELAGAVTTTSTPNNVSEIVSQSGGVNRTLTYDLNGSSPATAARAPSNGTARIAWSGRGWT